jgi:hypothetical protein
MLHDQSFLDPEYVDRRYCSRVKGRSNRVNEVLTPPLLERLLAVDEVSVGALSLGGFEDLAHRLDQLVINSDGRMVGPDSQTVRPFPTKKTKRAPEGQ